MVEQVRIRCSHRVGVAGAALLLLAAKGRTSRQLADDMSERFGIEPARVLAFIERLLYEGILVSVQEADQDVDELLESPEQRAAWYYHHGTFDFPFTDDHDDHGVSQTDRDLMKKYRLEHPDDFRCKQVRHGEVDLASDRSSVRGLDLGPARGQFNSAQKEVELPSLLWLLTAKIGSVRMGEGIEPAFLRTSPSGGSRHPTEIYVAYAKGCQLETPSLHHCQMSPAGLVSLPIPEGHSADQWADFGDSLSLHEQNEVFYLLFTTMFERNMYRYREPRTFRTVFMDVGHLVMTATRIFKNCGYQVSSSLALDHERIGKCLGLERLEESGVSVMRCSV
ncbi:MAG: hypothetical protein OXI96_04405 [Acidimicrobiaceae bacterium]|nr:hypothetical protein [Acidimicrobiaceae bacterium]